MVVRPAVDGSSLRPYLAKKMALISSVLPRENSATKATVRRSLLSAAIDSLIVRLPLLLAILLLISQSW